MKLTKQNLQLIGSAATLDKLEQLVRTRMYWAEFKTSKSTQYESRLGDVYNVANRNGVLENLVVIYSATRCGLYRIDNSARA